MPPAIPGIRLAGCYFTHFAVVGAIAPYLSPYLKALAYTPAQIGELTAMLIAGRIVAPTLWGWAADHAGRRMRIVRMTTLLAALSMALLLLARDYWALGGVLLLFGFFWSGSLPQFEAVTLTHLGARTEVYARIRVWGSIGFIATASGLGMVLQGQVLNHYPLMLLALVVAVWLSALATPDPPAPPPLHADRSLRRVLILPPVAALLAVVLLMQCAHGPYYAFYTIYLEEHGYSRALIGQLWSLGVLAEVLLFLVMHRLLPAFGLRGLMLGSLAAGVLRWSMVAWWADSLAGLILAQCLHAATFGMHHVAAVQLFHRYFIGRHQGRGQALYSSVAYGLGGAAGALASGYAWATLGGAVTYVLAAAVSLAAWFIAWRWLEREESARLPRVV